MDDTTPLFAPHGSSRFERRGQVLLLYSQGPFNAEHILSLAPRFRAHAAVMAPQGPWVTLNIVSRSMMGPPDSIEALGRSAAWSRAELGRIGAGYVADATVEGRRLMIPLIRRACEPHLATGFFEDIDSGLAWAHALLAGHPGG
jgi:hypothetical protein